MKTSTDRILTTHTGSLPRPNPLLDVIIGREKGDAIDLAGVPLIMDQAKNDHQRRTLKLIMSRQELAYTFAAPPELPDDRTTALRTAFDRTMKDPDFLAEAEKQAIEVAAMTGAEVDRLMKEIYETPPDLVAEARRVISP